MAQLYSHRGKQPAIHPSSRVAPSAILVGDVTIGPGSVVLHGAVLNAESAPVRVGASCVVMECAVLRGAGKHPAELGDRVLVGPHAHVTGATIEGNAMIATHAVVFNGAHVGRGCLIAIGAIVHVDTVVPASTRIPMLHIAVGSPATVYSPADSPLAHDAVAQLGFTRAVFDVDTHELGLEQSMSWLSETYSRALLHHGFGSPVEEQE